MNANDENTLNYVMSSCARFPLLLNAMRCSLLVSAHNLDCLFVIRGDGESLVVEHVRQPRLLGIALSDDQQRLSLASYQQIWDYRRVDPAMLAGESTQLTAGKDAVYSPCGSTVTGHLNTHDMAWGTDGLYMVNTRFNCIARPAHGKSFEVVWMPPFISELVPEDRCHLNGLAMKDGRPAYVSYFSQENSPYRWRQVSSFSGEIMSVTTHQPVVTGLCLPHSPRIHEGYLYFCESGTGRLWRCREDRLPASRTDLELVAELNGFTRGLSLMGEVAFVGLSVVRRPKDGSARHADMPLHQRREPLSSGVVALDLRNGEVIANLTFSGDLNQIYDVEVLKGSMTPWIVDAESVELSDLFIL
ncbi:TIGR03032 family protein [Photobacterium sp. 1_MG-2023]|uniref:TIGR03032 family protein n=1 Tax=Photobacterium sp. 1_MG-2023 TaxID=3062646 RepID=UPI0026E2C296|nr:TIGR03032 family protein [Photobacterium sp. 1_MG-2023]MDO6704977.1 TIGR03032 family protein [Photobacterium sp. 1_MG-2023]